MYRYSKRLSWSLALNEISQLTQAHTGLSLLDLCNSNPTVCFADYPHDLIREAFASVVDFRYQPEALGLITARRAIASFYARRGVAVQDHRLALTTSTSEAYALLLKLLCDPGDQILIPSPSYPLFDYLAALENVSLIPYDLRYDGVWYLDIADLQRRITGRTKAIVIVNPNNPTGSFLTELEQAQVVGLAADHHLPIISDEVFMDYAIRPRAGLSRSMANCDSVLSFSLNGLSKAAGMPQLKVAWIVVSGPYNERAVACERLELLSDTYLSVATPVQKALPLLLAAGEAFQRTIHARLTENLDQIDSILAETAAHRLQMDGGWSAILQLPQTRTEREWVTSLLQHQQVLVQPGFYFDMPSEAYIVTSLLTAPATLSKGLERVRLHLSQAV